MSRREDTDRRPLPGYTYHYEAVPPKSLDGQYPHGRRSTNFNDRKATDEATDSNRRKRHRELQDHSEMKRRRDVSRIECGIFAQTHDLRAGISPEERYRKEHPRRSEYSNKGDKPLPYPLPKSTSFHLEDQDILFEFPSYPGSLAGHPSGPYDASSSEYHWNPGAYVQPSARGEASSSSTQLEGSRQNTVGSQSPRSGLRRIDTYESTSSEDSLSTIALTDPLDLEEEYVWVQENVKVPSRRKKDWLHPFA